MKSRLKAFLLAIIQCAGLLLSNTVSTAQMGAATSEAAVVATSGFECAASFPGLATGTAKATADTLVLRMPLRGNVPVVSGDGRTLRLPVRQGFRNDGTLCILLEEEATATAATEGLTVRWTGRPPAAGQRIRIGEAVLALTRAPRYYERLMERPMTKAFHRSDVVGIINGTQADFASLAPAGWIVRVPLWLEKRTSRLYMVVLGNAPSPVAGTLIDSTVTETLRYVSSTVLLPTGYQASLSWTRNLPGIQPGEVFAFQRDMLPELRAMLKAAVARGVAGFDLENSYRSADWQKRLFDRRLAWSRADATIVDPMAATLRRVARPNGSEHQTGLAFDMAAKSGIGDAFAKTAEYAWLDREGWKYGFVVRYPAGSEAVTGIMFEPWHIRWLGVPMATWLQREGFVYEEMVAQAQVYGAVWLAGSMKPAGYAAASPSSAIAGSSTTVSSMSMSSKTQTAAAVGTAATPAPAASSTGTTTGAVTMPAGQDAVTKPAGQGAVTMPAGQDDIVWLAVAATPDAVYASAVSSLAPEISEFLADRRLWLVPMGDGGAIIP